MKLSGMENWGAMTPAARLELLGNIVVDLAARIPDLAGGEVDVRPVTRDEFTKVSDVVGTMVELHQNIDKMFENLQEQVNTIILNLDEKGRDVVAEIEDLKRRIAKLSDHSN